MIKIIKRYPTEEELIFWGAQEEGDYGPMDTLVREIKEEFSLVLGQENLFAPDDFIDDLKLEILKNYKIYGDFLSIINTTRKGKPRIYTSIDSAYKISLNKELFKDAEKYLNSGKKIINEGNLTISSLDNIVGGNPLCAWSTGEIISDMFDVPIPNPENNLIIPLSKNIKSSYADYRKDFSFKK